jgi:lupus La protein
LISFVLLRRLATRDNMSDALMKDQPEVATAAAEAQPVEETTATVATTEEGEKKTDAVADAENGGDKTAANILKTNARADHKDFKKNRKYDPTTQPVTDDPVKIRAQVRCSSVPERPPFCNRPD